MEWYILLNYQDTLYFLELEKNIRFQFFLVHFNTIIWPAEPDSPPAPLTKFTTSLINATADVIGMGFSND